MGVAIFRGRGASTRAPIHYGYSFYDSYFRVHHKKKPKIESRKNFLAMEFQAGLFDPVSFSPSGRQANLGMV
jgi:hypothetical protein